MPAGTKDDPWKLKTPPGTSEYEMYLDERDGTKVIVCVVGKTTLLYHARAIDDLHAMLEQRGDWVDLGSADEQKPAKDGTVESWGRSEDNPVGGWYGLKKGMRGAYAMAAIGCVLAALILVPARRASPAPGSAPPAAGAWTSRTGRACLS